jgi:PAS domain S-box-containing protein
VRRLSHPRLSTIAHKRAAESRPRSKEAAISSEPAEAAKVEILHAAVEAFQRREFGFREILEDLPAAIYTTDSEGRLTYFNRACVDFAGRVPVLGDDRWCVVWKLYTADGKPLPHDQSSVAVALKRERIVRGEEAIAERPDGTRIHFAPFPTPIFAADGECIGAVNMLVDITDQRMAHERLSLLAREVDHRSKNLLTLIQSLVRLTKADTVEEYRSELEGRISALAGANSLIADQRWNEIDVRALVDQELGAVRDRIEVDGPDLQLLSSSAQSLAMIIHELCTNAQKHGALSVESGKVRVAWAIDDSESFMLTWRESGGPVAVEPGNRNTGNAIIAAAARHLRGEFFRDWRAAGLHCTFLCSTKNLVSPPAA